MADRTETERVLRTHASAWLAGELDVDLASYHDEIELHYKSECWVFDEDQRFIGNLWSKEL